MPFLRHIVTLLLLLSPTAPGLAKSVMEHFEYFVVPVPVDKKVYIGVEIYIPTESVPRALVIVSPNSGGLADPYFDQELANSQYSPERRGGLTATLIKAGYAVAFYSQRGYELLGSCVSGNDFQARAASFVNACVSTGARAQVTLLTITRDTQAIFNALDTNSKTSSLPKLALAYSEGMHHVSTLAGKGLIRAAGIVGVGGPRSSLASVWQYQMQGDHEFRIAEKAFSSCAAATLNVDQIFVCANVVPAPGGAEKMYAFLGAYTASREAVKARREMMLQQYHRALAHYAASDPSETMEGAFGGNRIPMAYSAHYYKEVFESNTSIVEQLKNFQGRTKFLFGEFDHLFPELEEPVMKNTLRSAVPFPDTLIVPGVGHGLEDSSGFPPARALAAIVQALGDVLPDERAQSKPK